MGFALIGAGLILAVWGAGWLILFRLPCCGGAPVAAAAQPSNVSVIIPARNEEHNLPRLLGSIRAQEVQPGEVIVVDDGSSDRTAEIACQDGARVVSPGPLPPGWRGKAWACQQGAQAARGDLLLFLDADTYFLPGGFRRLLDTFQSVDGVLSVGPFHEIRRPYEHLSAFFNLLMMAGVGAFSAWARPGQAAGLFGPSLMIRAAQYAAVGGHESVRNQVLENLYLAGPLASRGFRRFCVSGRGSLAFRMYPDGLGSLIGGWHKAFARGAARTPPLLHSLIVAWLAGAAVVAVLLPLAIAGALPHAPWLIAGYLLFAFQIGFHLRRIGSFSPLAALVYPVLLAFFFGVFFRSLRGGPASWKGRDVSRTAKQE